MKQITLDKDSIFSLDDTDLCGNIKVGKVISSHQFSMDGIRKLEYVKDTPNFANHLWEYSAILKALVKNEMLIEMQKRIENIDTFYN